MVKSFLKVSVKTSLFPDYVLDDTLVDDIIYGANGVNDNDDENCNSNKNNDDNYLNDNNDADYNNKYDNSNDDHAIMISQTMHFVEPFIGGKAEFLVFSHIYVRR